MMLVSIVIVNYNHPECIDICTHSLKLTTGISYEVVVVDNGSGPETLAKLQELKDGGFIDTLVLNAENHMFSEGNNIGVRHASPESEYVLLLNSDVGIIRGDWLEKMIAWMEGTAKYEPNIWGLKPTVVQPGPFDIISFGWSHDANILPGLCRPEGFCCMFRKTKWRDMSPDFPYYYGFEEMVGNVVRDGARCGVLWNYAKYFIHREQGSGGKGIANQIVNRRTPDIGGWFAGLNIETLDFTLGVDEHSSYLEW